MQALTLGGLKNKEIFWIYCGQAIYLIMLLSGKTYQYFNPQWLTGEKDLNSICVAALVVCCLVFYKWFKKFIVKIWILIQLCKLFIDVLLLSWLFFFTAAFIPTGGFWSLLIQCLEDANSKTTFLVIYLVLVIVTAFDIFILKKVLKLRRHLMAEFSNPPKVVKSTNLSKTT